MNDFFKSKLIVFVIFIIINVFFVGYQKISHLDEIQQQRSTENVLEKELRNIELTEEILMGKTAYLEESNDNILKLKSDIEKIESKYQDSIPYHIYGHYKDKIDEYNLLVDRYNSDSSKYNMVYDEYDKHIANYNALVREANSLAVKVGTVRYIVPR